MLLSAINEKDDAEGELSMKEWLTQAATMTRVARSQLKPSSLQGSRKKTKKSKMSKITKIVMARTNSFMNSCFKKALAAMIKILTWLKSNKKKGDILTVSLKLTVCSIGQVMEAIG